MKSTVGCLDMSWSVQAKEEFLVYSNNVIIMCQITFHYHNLMWLVYSASAKKMNNINSIKKHPSCFIHPKLQVLIFLLFLPNNNGKPSTQLPKNNKESLLLLSYRINNEILSNFSCHDVGGIRCNVQEFTLNMNFFRKLLKIMLT